MDNIEGVPSDEELREVVFGPSKSEIEAARRMFREGLIPAVQSIIDLAAYGKNESTRLSASRYIVERNLGKVADRLLTNDAWSELLGEITATVEEKES